MRVEWEGVSVETTPEGDGLVIRTVTQSLALLAEDARWLATAALPAALVELPQDAQGKRPTTPLEDEGQIAAQTTIDEMLT